MQLYDKKRPCLEQRASQNVPDETICEARCGAVYLRRSLQVMPAPVRRMTATRPPIRPSMPRRPGAVWHRRRLGFDPFPDRVQVCARLGHVDDIPGPEAGGRGLRVLAPSLEFVAVACEPVVRVADDRVVAGDGRVRPLRVGGGSGVRVVVKANRGPHPPAARHGPGDAAPLAVTRVRRACGCAARTRRPGRRAACRPRRRAGRPCRWRREASP